MKIVVALLALALVLMGCGAGAETAAEAAKPKPSPSASPTQDTFTINGSITLTDAYVDDTSLDRSPCTGADGYDDIQRGTTVVVKDSADEVVATADLDEPYAVEGVLGTYTSCRYDFIVYEMADTSKFYSIEVANRGAQTYSREDLADDVRLTLGD